MAEYFSQNPRIMLPVGGKMPEIRYGMLEANSQSFKAGQLVFAAAGAAGGQITVCPSDATRILGIAQKDATNVTSGNIEIPVMIIKPGDQLAIKVRNGATDTASNTLYEGLRYGTILASNIHYLDLAEVTTDVFVFLSPILTGAGASTYWAKVNVIDEVLQDCFGVGA